MLLFLSFFSFCPSDVVNWCVFPGPRSFSYQMFCLACVIGPPTNVVCECSWFLSVYSLLWIELGLQLLLFIVLAITHRLFSTLLWRFIYEIFVWKNGYHNFPEPKVASSICFFYPASSIKPKYSSFTIINDKAANVRIDFIENQLYINRIIVLLAKWDAITVLT